MTLNGGVSHLVWRDFSNAAHWASLRLQESEDMQIRLSLFESMPTIDCYSIQDLISQTYTIFSSASNA
jgi:hypothetical protein